MKKSKGFTLIELLVVIAIIGILATIVLVSLNSARQKARDVRRIGDIRQVALALEMYYDDTPAGYPVAAACATGWATLTTAIEGGGYMTKVPVDPTNNTTYYYAYGGTATDYVLRATLENISNTAFNTDVDGTTTVGSCNCADGASAFYCIEP